MKAIVVALTLVIGCHSTPKKTVDTESAEPSREDACKSAGGTISTQSCCGMVDDFPGTCGIGACGCSPQNSHPVKTCQCPGSKCWDGKTCK